MKTNLKTRDSYIERLSEITSSIKSIYDKYSDSINNPEEIDNLDEYLKIATEVEDNLYKEIGPELLTNEQFLARISYLIMSKDLENKNDILNRIITYIAQSTYLNPFLSTEEDEVERYNENLTTIKNQASLDYLKGVFLNINEELANVSNNETKKKLVTAKSNLLFSNKILKEIMSNERNQNIDGRNRCLTFGQNKTYVEAMYKEFAYNIINYCIYHILITKENILEQIELKCALAILKKNELFEVSRKYYIATTENEDLKNLIRDNENHEIIINIIRNFMEDEKEPKKKRTL